MAENTEGILNGLTAGEAHALIRATANDRDHLILEMLWRTGARVEEILEMKVADVLDTDTLRLLNEKQERRELVDGSTWRYKPRRRTVHKTVYVDESLTQQIEYWAISQGLKGGDYLFPGRFAGHLTRQAVWKMVKKLGKSENIKKLKTVTVDGETTVRETEPWTHLFRHGAAINMVRQGLSIVAIKGQLGHASLKSTDVYARLFDEDRRKMVKTVQF